MSDRLPRTEYDVNYLQIIIFIIVFISLLLISFFAGYYAGKKSLKNQEKLIAQKAEQKTDKKPVKTDEIKKTDQTENNSVKTEQPKIEENKPEKEIPKVIKKEPLKTTEKKTSKKVRKPVKIQKRVYRKGYYIQVAAFKNLKSAKRKAAKFRKKFKVIIYYPNDSDKVKWYRLWIGPYAKKNRLNNALSRIKKEFGIEGIVRKVE